MRLTSEQRDAVQHTGHATLVACPGSGKTRAIVAKLLRCADVVRGTPRRVACITYTNAAVQEIEGRLRLLGATGDEDYCEVSTIHSFCLNNILRHFHWKLDRFQDGFRVLPADSDRFLETVRVVSDRYGLGDYDRQLFESLNRRPDGEPICPGTIPREAAVEFWEHLETAGFIDFCNIVYYSYHLLRENSSLCSNLASRFAFALVDEFQDTSALQVEILTLLGREGRTEFFVVGDPEQSIYSFAGAEPRLMAEFSDRFGASSFTLTGNFRSSCPIVAAAEDLIPREPTMRAVGAAAVFTEEPTHTVADDDFPAITDYFLPILLELEIPYGEAAILGPSWYRLMPLGRRLREYGIPVVGPGARPYKKRHLLASLAEQICAYVEKPTPSFVGPSERELFFLIQSITGKADLRVFTYEGRKTVFRLLREGQRLHLAHEGAREWLRAAAEAFAEILWEDGFVSKESRCLLLESAEDIIRDMIDKGVDVANLRLPDLGMFANPEDNLKLLTLHGAKGREFTAVGVIGLQDGLLPYHNQYNPLSLDGEAESRRLLYVAMTRAERVLMLFSSAADWRAPCRFLSELNLSAA